MMTRFIILAISGLAIAMTSRRSWIGSTAPSISSLVTMIRILGILLAGRASAITRKFGSKKILSFFFISLNAYGIRVIAALYLCMVIRTGRCPATTKALISGWIVGITGLSLLMRSSGA